MGIPHHKLLTAAFGLWLIVAVFGPGHAAADAQAVFNGARFEAAIRDAVAAKGYRVLTHTQWKHAPPTVGENILLTHVPFTTIYGTRGRTEFLLLSPSRGLRVRIEAKWQNVAGSTDEKLAYLYLNAVLAMPEPHVIIVIDGDGWRDGALKWLRDSAAGKTRTGAAVPAGKRVDVLSLEEFRRWVDATL